MIGIKRLDMNLESLHRLVMKDQNRIIRMKLEWSKKGWRIFEVSLLEFIGPIIVDDILSNINNCSLFEQIKELYNILIVEMVQQKTNSPWNWLFLPPGIENEDLFVRLGTIREKYVSCGLRIGNYNFVEIEVLGKRDLVIFFPGSDEEIKIKAGEKKIHKLVTSL